MNAVKVLLKIALCLLLFTAGISPLFAQEVSLVKNIRLAKQLNGHRIVFEIAHNTPYKVFTLKQPNRLVVDIENARLVKQINNSDFVKPDTPITNVRSALRNNKTLRIVFELRMPLPVDSFMLPPSPEFDRRLVVDLKGEHHPQLTAASVAQPKVTLPMVKNRDVIIIVDAGHGGKDPGALGKGHTREKDVTLAIAKNLAAKINQHPGMKAVMTRSGDYYVGLRERLNIARKNKGDIFISIHADAFKNSHARGSSTYALSPRGASSEAARWLAAKENYSELGEVNLEDMNDVLRSVLIDLSQTSTISASLETGGAILEQLGQFATLHHNKVEQAPFVVLKSPDIPSVLVETGFLSNPHEERLLGAANYQQKIATAIMEGIVSYFKKAAPLGTYFSEQSQGIIAAYIVKRGDTLSGIARRLGITPHDLREVNGLANDRLVIGQRLKLPAAH